MLRALAVLIVVTSFGCASQPYASSPAPDVSSVTVPPEPESITETNDVVMFAERLRQAVALIVSGFLSTGFSSE